MSKNFPVEFRRSNSKCHFLLTRVISYKPHHIRSVIMHLHACPVYALRHRTSILFVSRVLLWVQIWRLRSRISLNYIWADATLTADYQIIIKNIPFRVKKHKRTKSPFSAIENIDVSNSNYL